LLIHVYFTEQLANRQRLSFADISNVVRCHLERAIAPQTVPAMTTRGGGVRHKDSVALGAIRTPRAVPKSRGVALLAVRTVLTRGEPVDAMTVVALFWVVVESTALTVPTTGEVHHVLAAIHHDGWRLLQLEIPHTHQPCTVPFRVGAQRVIVRRRTVLVDERLLGD